MDEIVKHLICVFLAISMLISCLIFEMQDLKVFILTYSYTFQINNYDKRLSKTLIKKGETEEILNEQIILKNNIQEMCSQNHFQHLKAQSKSFIIDQTRHWAYCLHFKVIILNVQGCPVKMGIYIKQISYY